MTVEEKARELQKKLSMQFPAEDVKTREGSKGMKLDYIPINKVYERLNEIFPLGYDWFVKSVQFENKGKDYCFVVIVGSLTIRTDNGTITREGIGSDKVGFDPDKAYKTAFAEALKKASHSLGIALYLWDEDERINLQKERNELKNKSRAFNKTHLVKMKEIRENLKIDTDAKLNKFINKFDSKLKTKADLNLSNIDEFIGFLEEQEQINA